MRSKASFRGHPIHPALIPFPFAFLYGAFLFDLAGRLAERPTWWTIGAHLSFVGIVAALVAALVLGLEAIGVALLTAGGWMGGVLVNRNQIGVDHRYAYAGKWKEAEIAGTPGEPVEVAKSDELKLNQMKLLRINGRRLVLARTEAGYVAFDDRCTHRGGSLAGGVMIAGTVQCPWHGSQFDCRTGRVAAGPAEQPIEVYPVREEQGRILLTPRNAVPAH
jgi:nitrite reductase/ring-hydroxylating ferredoxin subunit